MNIRDAFRLQSDACAKLGSPFMEQLMALLADRLEPGSAVADRVLGWQGDPSPIADSVPLRLAGGLHALRIEENALVDVYPPSQPSGDALWKAVAEAMTTHEAYLLRWLDSSPQTNEVRRSAAILPALAVVRELSSLPVELIELGTSGGLNLRADRFRLELPGVTIGPAEARVVLTPEWRGELPPHILPDVVARSGVDIAPIDPATPAGRLRLLAYLWPDQPDRLARTEAAIAEATGTPATLEQDDAGEWLERKLAAPAPDRLRVVFHTIAWQYFPAASAARALKAMEGTRSPLVRIAMEADGTQGARLSLTRYPGGVPEVLARADFHGRWVEWTRSPTTG